MSFQIRLQEPQICIRARVNVKSADGQEQWGMCLSAGSMENEGVRTMTPFPWASTVTNGSAQPKRQLSGLRNPFPRTDPSLSGPGSELFTCLSVPPSGGGWQWGGTVPAPATLGSNGPITAKPGRGDWPRRRPLAVWSTQLKLL